MHPWFGLWERVDSNLRCLSWVFRYEVFDLAVVVLYSFMQSLWYKGCGTGDSGNLSTQVVFLFPEEVWVGEDWSLKITCQQYLDLSWSFDVSWGEVWKLGPFLQDAVSNPVDKLVDAWATSLLVSRLGLSTFTSFFSSLKCAFCNIVILLSPWDFTKEPNKACSRFFWKRL